MDFSKHFRQITQLARFGVDTRIIAITGSNDSENRGASGLLSPPPIYYTSSGYASSTDSVDYER